MKIQSAYSASSKKFLFDSDAQRFLNFSVESRYVLKNIKEFNEFLCKYLKPETNKDSRLIEYEKTC